MTLLRRHLMGAALALVADPVAAQTATPYAQRSTAVRYAAAIAEGRKRIAAYMTERGVPGLSIALSLDGTPVWVEGFGLADVEQGVPVTPATRFRSGSVAKPLSMAAAAVLHDQGRLDFDATVQSLLPDFPVKSRTPITFRMLAGMLGGFRHYRLGSDDFFNSHRYEDVVDALAAFKDEPLVHPPGTTYLYSSMGTNLQGAMTQAAGGKPFPELMQTLVFEPLGMTATTIDRYEEIVPQRTRYYERTGGDRTYRIRQSSWGNGERGVLLNAPYSANSNKFPSGGYMTTPQDLVRFGQAMLAPGFLKADTLRQLFTEQKTAAGKPTGYGMNWFVEDNPRDGPIWWHTGSSVGGNSILLLYPRRRLVLAIQTNLTDSRLRGLPRELAALFMA